MAPQHRFSWSVRWRVQVIPTGTAEEAWRAVDIALTRLACGEKNWPSTVADGEHGVRSGRREQLPS
jgi:hypothetical protein